MSARSRRSSPRRVKVPKSWSFLASLLMYSRHTYSSILRARCGRSAVTRWSACRRNGSALCRLFNNACPVSSSLAHASVSLLMVPDVVESDIARLMPLMHTWMPHYTDMNDARDHVRRVAERIRFQYTFHPEVADGRFKKFVQFNTAKRAWKDGKFKLSEVDEWKRARRWDKPALTKNIDSHTPNNPGSQDTLVDELDRFKISTKPYGSRPVLRTSSSFTESKSRASVPAAAPAVAEVESFMLEDHNIEVKATSVEAAELESVKEEKGEIAAEKKIDPFQVL
jgi:hypothetical protein